MIKETLTRHGLLDHLGDKLESGEVRSGSPLPWGARQIGDGVNFAIFSRHATCVRLEFYDGPGDATPSRTIELDPEYHRTGDVWHVWVRGISQGQLYGYRVDGPYEPQKGHRFNRFKLLLDPFATAIASVNDWDFNSARGFEPSSSLADLSFSTLDDAPVMTKCVLMHDPFDWEGDHPPRHIASETFIYETHVRGCTIHPNALLRPGRFDRQVVVDAPDLEGRDAILKLHARGKPLAPEVDLRRIAQETPGFSGADLANVINEAEGNPTKRMFVHY